MIIDKALLDDLSARAKASPRLRMNLELRSGPEDGSQRMLNVLEAGTHIPIHRHLKSSETVVCMEGCFDEVFFDEVPNMDAGGSVHNGEIALDETCFKEVARFRVCPREKLYGIQVPKMAWHSIASLCMSQVLSLKPRMGRMSRWGRRQVGIIDMQIFRRGRQLFMICDTVDDFDWERDMARLATLPRQAEWEAYVAQFQGCSASARSDEKWQRMEMIFDLSERG